MSSGGALSPSQRDAEGFTRGYPEWMKDGVVKKPIRFGGGFVHVPEGAGLGVEFDEDKLDGYEKGVMPFN